MDDTLAIVTGAFLLIAAAVVPKGSRDFFKGLFGKGAETGVQEWNDQIIDIGLPAETPSGSDYANNLTGSGGSQIDVTRLPLTRALTEAEVKALAAYIINAYNMNTDVKELTAMAWIESSFRPYAKRDEFRKNGTIWDTSIGLMQTLIGTANDLHNKGYKAFGKPDAESLKTPIISMYFGAAYLDWLRNNWRGKSQEWYIRAYNGGPGWEGTANGPKNTAVYWNKFVSAWKRFSISISFGG